jgi:hypothetical protein
MPTYTMLSPLAFVITMMILFNPPENNNALVVSILFFVYFLTVGAMADIKQAIKRGQS